MGQDERITSWSGTCRARVRVAFPTRPARAAKGACEFDRVITANFRMETKRPSMVLRQPQTMVLEQGMTDTAVGEMRGIPGLGGRITWGILDVVAFGDGRISPAQVRTDSGSLVAPLSGA